MNELFYFVSVLALRLQNISDNYSIRTAKEMLVSIADKIIRETTFGFMNVVQITAIDLRVFDYKKKNGRHNVGAGAIIIFINGIAFLKEVKEH
ncbi:MAG: hypothetical protein KJ799_18680 [Bacteroidetes bacterium]|nr:hypothetical protein [Bacteroidota bacterium]